MHLKKISKKVLINDAKILGLFGLLTVMMLVLFGIFFINKPNPVSAATCSSLGVNISQVSSPVHYIDTGISPQLTGMYHGYAIQNTSGSNYDDLWIQVENVSGAVISLGTYESGLNHLGALNNGITDHIFYYFTMSGASASAQSYNVVVYSTRPDLAGASLCSESYSYTAEETIKASANKVTNVQVIPNPPELGGDVTIRVTGDTGVMGGGEFVLTPSSLPDWPANAYRLLHSSLTFNSGGNSGTYANDLHLTGLNTADSNYTIDYTFKAIGITSSSTSVSPVNYITSGGNFKHTDTSSTTYTSLQPILPATNVTYIESKVADPDRHFTGGTSTFTITLTNTGSVQTYIDEIVDNLPSSPASASYVASSSKYNGLSIDDPFISGQELNWVQFFTIPAGGSSTLEYAVTIPSTEGVYTNTAYGTVNGIQIDATLDASNDTPVTESVTVGAVADLSISKSDSADPVLAGGSFSYTLDYVNYGPDTSSGAIITDTLPADVTYDSYSATTGSCTHSAGTVTCNLGNLINSSTGSITINVTADNNITKTITNTATISSSTNDDVSTNDTASEDTLIQSQTDISIVKSDTSDPATAGGNLSYSLTVTNNGSNDATNVELTDTLPAGFTYNSYTSDQGTCSETGGTVTCNIGTINGSNSVNLTISGTVASSASGSISNSASVSMDQVDTNAGNNSDSESTTITRVSDIEITKTDSADPAVAGDNLTYTLTITNNGPSDASSIEVSDTLPSEFTYGSYTTSAGSCSHNLGVVTCNATSLSASGTITIGITGTTSTTYSGTISNLASASATETDNNNSNDSDTETTQIIQQADISIVKTDNSDPAVAGENLTYTLTVTNNGPSQARTVVVSDTLPSEFNYSSYTASAGSCSHLSGTVTCNVGDINNSGTVTITVTGSLDRDTGSSISNTASVTSDTTDPTPTNNSESESTTVNRNVDLSITKTDSQDPVNIGQSFSYNLSVLNSGPSDAQSVVVTDTLDSGLDYDGYSSSTGSCTFTSPTLTCNLGDIVYNDTETVTINVTPNNSASGSISNTASVASSSNETNNSDNSSTQSTVINAQSDLVLTKTGANTVVAGGTFVYSLLATNNGASTATNVTISDNLPSGMTYNNATATQGTCGTSSGTVLCNIGTINNGDSESVTLTVNIDEDFTGNLINSSSISGDQDDPNNSNNSDSHTVNVSKQADLVITKSDSTDPVVAGESLSYTLTATNNGPSSAQNVTITDTLPSELTINNVSSLNSTCGIVGQVVTCTKSLLPSSGTIEVLIETTVDYSTLQSSINNSATVNSTTNDPNSSNNNVLETTNINRVSDLDIIKSSNVTQVNRGDSLEYSILVSNSGPSIAESVVVSDVLPLGLTFISASPESGSCLYLAGVISCSLGNINKNESRTIIIEVSVEPTTELIEITNTGSVSLSNTDLDLSNNISDYSFDVTDAPNISDLAIEKIVSSTNINSNEQLIYTINITNNGPDENTNIEVTENLPAGLNIISSNVSLGTYENNTWSIPVLENGQTETLTLITLPETVSTITNLTNSVEITNFDNEDPDLSNNSDSNTTTVNPPANPELESNLAVNKIEKEDPVNYTDQIEYMITVTNNGPDTAKNVTLTDILPDTISRVVTVTHSSGSCSIRFSNVSCLFETIENGESEIVNIIGEFEYNNVQFEDIENTATVTSEISDPDNSDNISTVETRVLYFNEQDTPVSLETPTSNVPSSSNIFENIVRVFVSEDPQGNNSLTIVGAVGGFSLVGLLGFGVLVFFLGSPGPMGVVIGGQGLSITQKLSIAKKLNVKYFKTKDIVIDDIL